MVEKWAAKARGDMYAWDITGEMLARELGITPQYLSAIFNGKKPSAPIKHRITAKIKEMIERKKTNEHR